MIPPATLAEPVVQLADLALNQVDEHGVEWWLSDLEGWDSPASSTEATQRSGDHGAWLTPGHLTARQLVLTGHTHAPSPQACRDAETRLATAAGLEDVQLVVHEHGLTRYAVVRRSGPVLWDYLDATSATWSLSLIAGDPRRYGLAEHRAQVRLASITGGLTLPVTAPLVVAARVTPNQARLTNAGNVEASPLFVIRGPVSDPTLVLDGRAIRFGLDLATGQMLLVGVAARTVEISGGAVTAARHDRSVAHAAARQLDIDVPGCQLRPGRSGRGHLARYLEVNLGTVPGKEIRSMAVAWR